MKGSCLQCPITEYDDIEAHTRSAHNRKPQEAEKYSGAIRCKRCHNFVRLPRGKKYELPQEHICERATQEKEPPKHWFAPDGRDQNTFPLTVEATSDREMTPKELDAE